MADFTNEAEQRVLDWIFNLGSPTRPTSHYVALYTTTPTDDIGTNGVEVSDSGYTRQAGTFARSGQTVSNSSAITFGPMSSAVGSVVGFGIYDAQSSGNCLMYESLTSSRSVGAGDSAQFAASALTCTID